MYAEDLRRSTLSKSPCKGPGIHFQMPDAHAGAFILCIPFTGYFWFYASVDGSSEEELPSFLMESLRMMNFTEPSMVSLIPEKLS